ncbi:M23 family metallopeptidase [Streptomyces sp. NPDC006923]|uniref:M23 family metallopeptidase n=1 Tax=Streptomyces sp. NPDC006923 TaxID=3155355 RepID=UPI0033E55135
MSLRNLSRLPRPAVLRTRAGVVAAGLGVSMACGGGAALAATSGGAPAAPVSTSTGASAAAAVQKQAAAQAGAAAKAHEAHLKKVKAKQAKVKAAKAKARANARKAASWTDPVDHYRLSAGFGIDGSRWAHKHSGQDFAVPIGTAVHAAHSGTVVKAGPNGAGDGPAYGNAIVIKHKNGTYSQYAHLSKVKVYVGEHVTTDQRIALSGNTGNSTGPHLHFEIRSTPNYGSAINPVPFLHHMGVKV